MPNSCAWDECPRPVVLAKSLNYCQLHSCKYPSCYRHKMCPEHEVHNVYERLSTLNFYFHNLILPNLEDEMPNFITLNIGNYLLKTKLPPHDRPHVFYPYLYDRFLKTYFPEVWLQKHQRTQLFLPNEPVGMSGPINGGEAEVWSSWCQEYGVT